MALRDISDNANKMGSDTKGLTETYKSLARGQYQLLDNLKLGYGGTKAEMERLLKDAKELTGVEYDISSLADVYTAIHVIQEEMGITGTTAKEASTTLTGSFNSMKAAAQNVLGDLALGRPMEESLEALKETTDTFLTENFLPMVGNVLEGLPGCLEAGISGMRTWLETEGNVEGVLNAAWELGTKILDAIIKGLYMSDDTKVKEAMQGLADNIITSFNGGGTKGGHGGIGGSFAKGLNYVPYDGFIAELHEGEMVLTRNQARKYRAGQNGRTVQVIQNFYGSTHTAADQQAAARYEQEKAVMGLV
jgi:hypothetical protein